MADRLLVTLDGFRFPPSLPFRKANFRFLVEARYFGRLEKTASNAKILPDAEDYWECDPNEQSNRRYVGPDFPSARYQNPPSGYGAFDPAKLDDVDRSFLVVAEHLQALKFTVWDVDRKDFLDSVLGSLSNVVEKLLEAVEDVVPDAIGLPDDLATAVAKKIAGPGDRQIGSVSEVFGSTPSGQRRAGFTIPGGDYGGEYEVTYSIAKL